MGDFKGEIKVQFRMHDKTYEWESGWVNLVPFQDPLKGYGSTAERLEKFFDAAWSSVMSDYDDLITKAEEKAQEARERKELERLKAKYGP